MKIKPLFIIVLIICSWFCFSCQQNADRNSFTVVSFPDFFNFDVPEPWPQWDASVNWFLEQVAIENPEFVLVAGDLVNGHWWDSPKCIEQMGTLYYNSWKRRLESHNLTYYVAVGDHELGDDPWPAEKLVLVPHFERVFAHNMPMPQNGASSKKGLTYYVRHKNALFITVETFEIIDSSLQTSVIGEQLTWVKQVLADNQDADFIIIQGHVPIFGKPKARSSSMLMLKDSTTSEFWNTMVHADVDLYLCGEFHDVTINEKGGIWQIVHGSSWGRKVVNTMDYLVIEVHEKEMNLTMKSFPMEAGGDNMWNLHKENGPREIVLISEDTRQKGPEVTGTLTIDKTRGEKAFTNISGVFSSDQN